MKAKRSIAQIRQDNLCVLAIAARVTLADPERYGPGMVAIAQVELATYEVEREKARATLFELDKENV